MKKLSCVEWTRAWARINITLTLVAQLLLSLGSGSLIFRSTVTAQ
jgi:hypothetical protein